MILRATVLAGAVAFVSSAASLPANGLTGTYIEARIPLTFIRARVFAMVKSK